MAAEKLLAGHAVRRLRLSLGLSQAGMAEALDISASYLNLVERNQRPVSATLLLRLADRFDYDPRKLAERAPGGGEDAVRRRLADPLFADLSIDRAELTEWLAAAPGGVEAFARAFDRLGQGGGGDAPDPEQSVRAEIERWQGHYADLDAAAEALADTLRLTGADLPAALAERLRVTHRLTVRIVPVEVMPDALTRLDLHARTLMLSELLDPASRSFALAFQTAALEARAEIDGLVTAARLTRPAERRYRRHLTSYFAAALMMPYARFLRACEATGYDLELLQHRFGAGFEQVAHRLTTLGRVGARGLPFFMLRIDRAGQVSKRFAGMSHSPLVDGERCPLWDLHEAFARPGQLIASLSELQDGSRWVTLARTVRPQAARLGGVTARFVVGVGLSAALAGPLAAARGLDLAHGPATPIGPGCRRCHRPACPQRSAAPADRAPVFRERERGLSPFDFAD